MSDVYIITTITDVLHQSTTHSYLFTELLEPPLHGRARLPTPPTSPSYILSIVWSYLLPSPTPDPYTHGAPT